MMHVCRLVEYHHHVIRAFGTESEKIYTGGKLLCIDSTRELGMADSKLWQYPKENYELYTFANSNTVKRHIPYRLKILAPIKLGVPDKRVEG